MPQLTSRRYDLDWLRVIAFLILIFYHSGMFYVTWDWHVKSIHAGPEAEWLMRLSSPWRLSLLFFISGLALRFAADKRPAGAMMKSRLLRLGLPILCGMILVVAPQSWLQLVESGEFQGSFFAFWPHYIDPTSEFSITTPTWNHLWYVVYLLVYSLMILPFAGPFSRFASGAMAKLARRVFAGRMGIVWAVVVPVAPHLLYRVVLDPHFPTTHDLTWDWANHAHSLTMVLTGYFLAKDEAFWDAIRRGWKLIAGLTIAMGAVMTLVWNNWELFGGEVAPLEAWLWPARVGRVLFAWMVIYSLLGMAQQFLNRDSKALRYLTDAVFPWYILHQTLIVMFGFWLTRQGLPVAVEATLVIGLTVLGCVVGHELVRRIPLVRLFFGLKGQNARMRRTLTVTP